MSFVTIAPVLMIFISNINIYYIIRKKKARTQPENTNNPVPAKQTRLQRQMLLLMISSVILFMATTLPMSIFQITNAYLLGAHVPIDMNQIINEESVVNLLIIFNYAVSSLFINLM